MALNFTIPHLPVIDTIMQMALKKVKDPLKNTAIIYIHHPLQTSLTLLDAIIRLGAKQKNIYVLGKFYSECTAVVDHMMALGVHYQPCSRQTGLAKFSSGFIHDINLLWSKVIANLNEKIEQILILDHGGHAVSCIPDEILNKYKIIGVEKTTGGLINLSEKGFPPFPIIGAANCAVKRILESPLIAESVVNKLDCLVPITNRRLTCGVVGYGAIGKAVSHKLFSMGHRVIVYDGDPAERKSAKTNPHAVVANELSELIISCEYIFGCTGSDITTSTEHFRFSEKDKTLISCSSEDKEFLSLLQLIEENNHEKILYEPLNNIQYHTEKGAKINIVRGGFPVNFDKSGESVPARDIQLTRAIVLISILQAIDIFKNPLQLKGEGIYALDPIGQSFIVSEWLKYQPANRFQKTITDNFRDIRWIMENSRGLFKPCRFFESLFNHYNDEEVAVVNKLKYKTRKEINYILT